MIHWFWFWLILLGLITYFVIKRNVAGITRTPVWLLWAVMMTPALLWTAWIMVQGTSRSMPLLLQIGPFIVCPIIYWWLIQRGRILPLNQSHNTSPEEQSSTESSDSQGVDPQSTATNGLRPIDKEEEARLQTCFPWTVYYLQKLEYRPQAVICRGQLRSTPELAYETVQKNVASHFGDRFLVLFQEGLNGKPFFALVPNPQVKQTGQTDNQPITRPGLALSLLGITFLTTLMAGVEMTGVDLESSTLPLTLGTLAKGLPYALPLLLILGIHELGHYLAARRYRIQTTLPYFIPVPLLPFLLNLGTFGAFIQMRSPIPNRRALFDVGIAGPLSGLVMTIPILLWGLAHSTPVPLPKDVGLLSFTAINPHTSLILFGFSKLMLGKGLTPDSGLNLHPVAIAGYLGLVVTALNLIPVGQLDGGHIVHAMFGQRTGALIGQIARFLILLLALFIQKDLFLWAIILLFIPAVDEPALNDVTELDDRRDLLGLATLAILVLIILPAPKVLIQWLSG